MSTFTRGQSVMYNSKCCTVFRIPGKRANAQVVSGYLLRENESKTVHDNVAESQIMSCNCAMICNDVWPNFIYTGNNKEASAWLMDNLIAHLSNTGNADWGPNETNTVYTFTMGGTVWSKNKTTPSA